MSLGPLIDMIEQGISPIAEMEMEMLKVLLRSNKLGGSMRQV